MILTSHSFQRSVELESLHKDSPRYSVSDTWSLLNKEILFHAGWWTMNGLLKPDVRGKQWGPQTPNQLRLTWFLFGCCSLCLAKCNLTTLGWEQQARTHSGDEQYWLAERQRGGHLWSGHLLLHLYHFCYLLVCWAELLKISTCWYFWTVKLQILQKKCISKGNSLL